MAYGNNIIKNLYYKSPFIVKNLIASIYGYNARCKRYGKYYTLWYDYLKKSQYFSNSDLIKARDNNTIEFINKVLQELPFYSQLYNVTSINNIDEIKKLPLITKLDIKRNIELLKNKKIKNVIYSHSSGTTGSSIIFPITEECFQREYAFRALHYSWSGVDLNKKPRIATFSGHPVTSVRKNKPPFWVYDYANNWLIFSSYHMSDQLLKFYIKEIESFDPALIHGYPSSVYLIALSYKKFGKSLKNLKAIYTASETLLPFQRAAIEDAFQVKVYNWYGNSEMCANIVECEKGNLHLKYEHSFVEILNENQEECKPGEKGRLVCTGFGNPAFPLIRYDIKDEVVVSENQECPCGRSGLIIKEIIGRVEDYIITPSGRRIGRLDHLFKDTLNIIEAQVYQSKIDEVELRIVTNNNVLYPDDEKKIWDEVKLRFSDEIKVKIVPVRKIERGPNNKFRFILSEIKPGDFK
ncbi:MAG: hypothetical protein N2043_10930 [Ignavibacterium sp.]|nr:hypothetical protein [Ignavibacterium sp.]